jgi:hypothetical protein
MVYLIGGAPRIGKSIAARKLAAQLGIQALTADEIGSEYSAKLPEAERIEKFPFPGFSGNPADNTLSPKELTRLQIIEAKSMEPEFRRLIAEAVAAGRDFVLEGVQVLPEFAKDIVEHSQPGTVKILFVGSEDVSRIIDGMAKNTSPDDWLRDSDAEVIKQVAAFAVDFSAWLKKACADAGLPYFERTDDFQTDLEHIVGSLLQGR